MQGVNYARLAALTGGIAQAVLGLYLYTAVTKQILRLKGKIF